MSQASAGQERAQVQATAYLAGKPGSRRPVSVSPVVGEFLRSWIEDAEAKDLPLLTSRMRKAVGTAASGAVEEARSWMALDWYCRVSAPGWLRAAGRRQRAREIEATAPIVDNATAKAALKCLTTGEAADRLAEQLGDAVLDVLEDAALAAQVAVGDGTPGDFGLSFAAAEAALDAMWLMSATAVVIGEEALEGAVFRSNDDAAWRAMDAAWKVSRDAVWKVAVRSVVNADMESSVVDLLVAARTRLPRRASRRHRPPPILLVPPAVRALARSTISAALQQAAGSLRPTADALRESALALLDRMIAAGPPDGGAATKARRRYHE